MNQPLYPLTTLLAGFALSFVSCWLLLLLLIRLSPTLGLVDRPNSRKVHQLIIPAIGGLAIGVTIFATALVYSPLQTFFANHGPLAVALLVLLALGVVDDRLNSSALLRLLIQGACALAVAHYGIRLTSLHGVFGITTLPLLVQYGLTTLILTGMANAFNLIDGIDGLAGSLAVVNCLLLAALAALTNQVQWLPLLLPVLGALLAFLKGNWHPARLFMGDAGSVVLGFLMACLGIALIEGAYQQATTYRPQVVVLIVGSCMLPVLDALRVFGSRISKGDSPFSADRNHMHHWLLKHHFTHAQITMRIVGVHTLLLLSSLAASYTLSMSVIIIAQIGMTLFYTRLVQLSHHFLKSYQLVKRLENR